MEEKINLNISELLGETTEYDKKRAVEMKKPKSWLKSVSAFANGNGGVLIFGIADDDTVVGIDDIKTTSEFLSQKIKERIEPFPEVKCGFIKWKKGKIFLRQRLRKDRRRPIIIGEMAVRRLLYELEMSLLLQMRQN